MIDYLDAIRRESARFGTLIRSTPLDAPVPSCPGWDVAELAWHLTEVQDSWGAVVDGLLADLADADRCERPEDDAALADLFDDRSARMLAALTRRNPDDECWSWHPDGRSVRWVRRRQAHEALIHRVDAELAARESTPLDAELAADGVDEILNVMLDADQVPEWAAFEPTGDHAVIEIDGGEAAWALELGRFVGTSPNTGNSYDFPAVRLLTDRPTEPAVLIRGTGAAVDLWLWGRGPRDTLEIVGDPEAADFVRAAAADATQ